MSTINSSASCDRCNRLLPPGDPHYVFTLRMLSGFDGVIHMPENPAQHEIATILEETRELSEEELEDTVDLTRLYTVCPSCRKHILNDPLQRGSKGPSGLLS